MKQYIEEEQSANNEDKSYGEIWTSPSAVQSSEWLGVASRNFHHAHARRGKNSQVQQERKNGRSLPRPVHQPVVTKCALESCDLSELQHLSGRMAVRSRSENYQGSQKH